MDQNWTNQNGIFQLSVAHMEPLATSYSSHLEVLSPPDTRSHPQDGVQIYQKGKFTTQNHERNIFCVTSIFTKFT